MRPRNSRLAGSIMFVLLVLGLMSLMSCGGGGPSSAPAPSPSTSSPVNNTQAIKVNLGPANNYVNGVFTDITICVPGSTNCETIPDVLVDTGSEGLRLLSSQVSLSLPAKTDNGGDQLRECAAFSDGSYLWGPVVNADIKMAGEKASSVPIQLISANPAYAAPSQCTSSGGTDENTTASLGANGIVGIGVFRQDCGTACSSSPPPPLYYLCDNSGCQPTSVSAADQLQNPVGLFPQDNNGLLISLPSIPAGGQATASGSLIFGIGTQSDNDLGSAKVYTTDPYGNFQTTYQGLKYNQSFIDSGSNGLYFLDSSTLGIRDCSDAQGFYCPSGTVSYTVTNTGLNGTTGQVNLNVANADLLPNTGFAAFNDLGGDSGTSPSTDYFDFGLPFFYGRKVYIGIENKPGPNGVVGPYWAY